jgi:hypothetical protein
MRLFEKSTIVAFWNEKLFRWLITEYQFLDDGDIYFIIKDKSIEHDIHKCPGSLPMPSEKQRKLSAAIHAINDKGISDEYFAKIQQNIQNPSIG